MAKGTGSKAPAPKKTGKMPAALKEYWNKKNGEKKTTKTGTKKSGK